MKSSEYIDMVVEGYSHAPNERHRVVMQSLVRHLLDFAVDVNLTTEEWLIGIDFLTRSGRVEDRPEIMLGSDMLGLSALVDRLAAPVPEGATEATPYGPFYKPDVEVRPFGDTINLRHQTDDRIELVMHGRVRSLDGDGLADATVDVWQDDPNGLYDLQDPEQPDGNMRGVFRTDSEGRYRLRSLKPTPYPVPTDGPVGEMLEMANRHPMRPAHIHAHIEAPDHGTLTTHIYVGDDKYIDSDVAFGVKESLRATFRRVDNADRAAQFGVTAPFDELEYDFVLAPAE